MPPARLLRPGLLAGLQVVAARGGDAPPIGDDLGGAVAARWAELGAEVRSLAVDPLDEEAAVEAAAAALSPAVSTLAWDGAGAFGAAGGASVDAVRAAVDGGWLAVRAIARAAMIDRGGGQILLLTPRSAGADAAAARAALENLARTLSIEWSRFAVRTVAIHPGPATSAAEVAELAAFLSSPAGEYYSGCAFTLG